MVFQGKEMAKEALSKKSARRLHKTLKGSRRPRKEKNGRINKERQIKMVAKIGELKRRPKRPAIEPRTSNPVKIA
jgi:hypothetical protein